MIATLLLRWYNLYSVGLKNHDHGKKTLRKYNKNPVKLSDIYISVCLSLFWKPNILQVMNLTDILLKYDIFRKKWEYFFSTNF